MSKPFLIINVVDGVVGVICKRYDYGFALKLAMQMVIEQCNIHHTNQKNVKEELESSNAFYDPNGNWSVQIAQTE